MTIPSDERFFRRVEYPQSSRRIISIMCQFHLRLLVASVASVDFSEAFSLPGGGVKWVFLFGMMVPVDFHR